MWFHRICFSIKGLENLIHSRTTYKVWNHNIVAIFSPSSLKNKKKLCLASRIYNLCLVNTARKVQFHNLNLTSFHVFYEQVSSEQSSMIE